MLIVAASVGFALAITFGGLEPSVDGAQLPSGARLLAVPLLGAGSGACSRRNSRCGQ
jgi:hypothetical protein